MQGFNRYIPPDYDPKANSTLNSHQGKKHALGKRAKDIDKGILVVRFELPFNIWCGSCNAHIGAGVRYNAQKQKVGNYYSTPIFGFRCKCHLCQNWFELRTDPKNAAYVVHEGATRKDEDWDPEENGGFAVHDTEAPSAAEPPADPFAHIEKTIDQQTWAQTKKTRLSELYDASDRLSSDPYIVSSALRRKFRVEKGLMLDRQRRDDEFRDKYGLSLELDLGGETPVGNVKGMWEAGRERRGLSSDTGEASGSRAGVSTRATKGTPSRKGKEREVDGIKTKAQLAQSLRATTSRKYDPFASAADTLLAGSPGGAIAGLKVKTKTKDPDKMAQVNTGVRPIGSGVSIPGPKVGSLGGGLLAGYDSD